MPAVRNVKSILPDGNNQPLFQSVWQESKHNFNALKQERLLMPGGGLLALVSYGSQNVILNGNPEFTYFYKVFKRYAHFSVENTTLPLDGPNELFYDGDLVARGTNISYSMFDN
jgi:hypothetical protein